MYVFSLPFIIPARSRRNAEGKHRHDYPVERKRVSVLIPSYPRPLNSSRWFSFITLLSEKLILQWRNRAFGMHRGGGLGEAQICYKFLSPLHCGFMFAFGPISNWIKWFSDTIDNHFIKPEEVARNKTFSLVVWLCLNTLTLSIPKNFSLLKGFLTFN